MRLLHVLLTVLVGLAGISCRTQEEAGVPPSLICTSRAPDERDKQLRIYEDEAVTMVGVGYGDATWQSQPGFFVFRKADAEWLRVERVSTEGATFGRSPTFEEARDAEKMPPSIGWDFRSLANEDCVDFPLTFQGFLFFPDKVEFDGMKRQYVLRFNSKWGIEGVETVLRLPAEMLIATSPGPSP